MNWVLYLKYFLSLLIVFLTLGGAWVIMTTAQLKYYEVKERISRVLIGLIMIVSGIGSCLLYKEYVVKWIS